MYIFDTSAFIVLKHYYRPSFPSLWTGLEELIEGGGLASTRARHRQVRRQPRRPKGNQSIETALGQTYCPV